MEGSSAFDAPIVNLVNLVNLANLTPASMTITTFSIQGKISRLALKA
jgi:hypothetical protein